MSGLLGGSFPFFVFLLYFYMLKCISFKFRKAVKLFPFWKKQKKVPLNSSFLPLIAFAPGRVIHFQAFTSSLPSKWQSSGSSIAFSKCLPSLSSQALVHFPDPSLSSFFTFPALAPRFVKRTQPHKPTPCTLGRERYSFLRLNFESHSCCHTSRVLKTTTNPKSEQVQSQFGNVPLAPASVNSAHVGSILTPFCFPYSFLGASSRSSPGSRCSWGRAPGCVPPKTGGGGASLTRDLV